MNPNHILKSTTLSAVFLLGLCLGDPAAFAADATAFSDGFEGAALDPFWTKRVSNASITLQTTGPIHSGLQAAQFASSGSGQKEAWLDHFFDRPQYGSMSVWVYDQKNYIYFSATLYNASGGYVAGIGVQDWDTGTYYSVGGKTAFPRTVAWHKFKIDVLPTGIVTSIDGQTVYSGPGGVPFSKLSIQLSGPGSGGVIYDDFLFEPAPEPPPVQISALNTAGQLSWTNTAPLTNGLFTVEWAPALGTNWHSSWSGLEALMVTGLANSVSVPMVYRLQCITNLFVPIPANCRLVFNVSNLVANVGTEQLACLARVKPTVAGDKQYWLMENTSPAGMGFELLRSTESALYRFDPATASEFMEFCLGPVGTTWTNYNYEGEWTVKVTVDAIETVTVPAGTFPGCYKFHKQVLNPSGPSRADWFEWVKPGFGFVKWLDYWVDASENPPVTHELKSYSIADGL